MNCRLEVKVNLHAVSVLPEGEVYLACGDVCVQVRLVVPAYCAKGKPSRNIDRTALLDEVENSRLACAHIVVCGTFLISVAFFHHDGEASELVAGLTLL